MGAEDEPERCHHPPARTMQREGSRQRCGKASLCSFRRKPYKATGTRQGIKTTDFTLPQTCAHDAGRTPDGVDGRLTKLKSGNRFAPDTRFITMERTLSIYYYGNHLVSQYCSTI